MTENKANFSFSIDDNQDAELNKEKGSSGKKVGMIFAKIGITLVSVAICISVAVLGVSGVICYGPSDNFKEKFVEKVMENNYTKFLAEIYLSDQEIVDILSK